MTQNYPVDTSINNRLRKRDETDTNRIPPIPKPVSIMQWIPTQHRYECEQHASYNEKHLEYR